MYGGKGIIKISVFDFELIPPFVSVVMYKVYPNASIGLHQHQVDNTLLLCILGFARINMDGISTDLSAQDTVMIPCKSQLSIYNISDTEQFVFWLIKARQSIES